MAKDDAATEAIDRRRHYRPMARLDAKVLSQDGHAIPADLRVETVDVAVGGVRCTCSIRLQATTLLRLALTLVGGDLRQPVRIEAEARVLRCSERPAAPDIRRYDVAFEFVRMDPRDREILQRFVNGL